MTAIPPDLDAIRKRCEDGSHVMYLQADVRALLAFVSTQAETIERLKRDHAKALSDVLLAQDDAVVQRIMDMPNEEILRLTPKSELDASALSGELTLTKALLTVEKRRAEAAEASAAALRERVEKAVYVLGKASLTNDERISDARALLKGAPANVE